MGRPYAVSVGGEARDLPPLPRGVRGDSLAGWLVDVDGHSTPAERLDGRMQLVLVLGEEMETGWRMAACSS
jgi:hypothetical protein